MQCLAMPVFKTILGHGLAAKTKVYKRLLVYLLRLQTKKENLQKKYLSRFSIRCTG